MMIDLLEAGEEVVLMKPSVLVEVEEA